MIKNGIKIKPKVWEIHNFSQNEIAKANNKISSIFLEICYGE